MTSPGVRAKLDDDTSNRDKMIRILYFMLKNLADYREIITDAGRSEQKVAEMGRYLSGDPSLKGPETGSRP